MSTDKRVLGGVLALITGTAAALFFGAAPAYADNGPHQTKAATVAGTVTLDQMGADRCASCHRAHTAKSAYLLAASSQENLCFTCHGDGGTGATTDVQSGIAYGGAGTVDATGKWIGASRTTTVAGALRGGGFETAMIGASQASKEMYVNGTRLSARNQTIPALSAPAAATSSHLGGPNTMWGNGAISATDNPGKVTDASTKLECGSCHDPHGNNQYRILKPIPVGSGATTGITIQDTVNKVYTTTNYWKPDDHNYAGGTEVLGNTTAKATAALGGPTAVISNISAWCSTCHTRLFAGSGAWNKNTGDATYTYMHRSNSGAEKSPNCLTCHVSHGSNASMQGDVNTQYSKTDVKFPNGTVSGADSFLLRVDNRGTCNM